MFCIIRLKKRMIIALLLVCVLAAVCIPAAVSALSAEGEKKDFIKWVDFDIPSEAMKSAMTLDIGTYEDGPHMDWVQSLAYLGAKYGGDFSLYKGKDLNALAEQVKAGKSIDSLGQSMKSYAYYKAAYGAVLGGLVGEYELETDTGWEKKYGLKAYSPIAQNFYYTDYDDFGVSRSYGYKRRHLGHDMMAQIGTPVVAVESGVVEAMGWNQYGGWRIGIRSFDGLRYHYYAHLRKDRPFAEGLEVGQTVMAGDVIGYVGRTGYSAKENVNNINTSHLHYGLQLIFDESQKEGNSEIWVDVYDLCNILKSNPSNTRRNDETKEWTRVQCFREEPPKDRFVIREDSAEEVNKR